MLSDKFRPQESHFMSGVTKMVNGEPRMKTQGGRLSSPLRSMLSPDLLRSQVCRSSEEILDTHEQWRAAMLEKGWQAQSS